MSAGHGSQSEIEAAQKAYTEARNDLRRTLGRITPDAFDHIASLAEEFGPRHLPEMLRRDPRKYGLRPAAVAAGAQSERLEQSLENYVLANEELDRAVAKYESQRSGDQSQSKTRRIAIHGHIAEVRLADRKISYEGREPEDLNLREGAGPDRHTLARNLSRRRTRSR